MLFCVALLVPHGSHRRIFLLSSILFFRLLATLRTTMASPNIELTAVRAERSPSMIHF